MFDDLNSNKTKNKEDNKANPESPNQAASSAPQAQGHFTGDIGSPGSEVKPPSPPNSGIASPPSAPAPASQPKPPAGQGNKPAEDIFANTDKTNEQPSKPPVFQPKGDVASDKGQPGEKEPGAQSKDKDKKIIIIAAGILALILLGLGGYWAYSKYFAKAPAAEQPASNETPEPAPEPVPAPEPAPEPVPAPEPEVNKPADTDQDGLSDDEEKRLGTNINSVDSDDDGLFDREEVKIYKTDPMNADSDGDGYLDGAEVKAGYNPNGSGKLFEIN